MFRVNFLVTKVQNDFKNNIEILLTANALIILLVIPDHFKKYLEFSLLTS